MYWHYYAIIYRTFLYVHDSVLIKFLIMTIINHD